MTQNVPQAWPSVLLAASTMLPPAQWRLRLARALYEAIGEADVQSVGVVTSPFDRYDQFEVELWPRFPDDAVERWARSAVPGFARHYPWRAMVDAHGSIYPARIPMPPEVVASMDETLRAVGASGCVLALVLLGDEVTGQERCAGYLTFHIHGSERAFIARHAASIAQATAAAAVTLGASLAIVRELEAQPPEPGVAALTRREREIAELVSQGLSDLNIATRLGITEATVGTHLHRAFRKLGVHTRVDLLRALGRGTQG